MAGLLGGMDGDMSKAMSDPKFLESAMGMMRGMDEDSLASMMASSGMCGADQAKNMAKQVGLDPRALLLGEAGWAGSAVPLG